MKPPIPATLSTKWAKEPFQNIVMLTDSYKSKVVEIGVLSSVEATMQKTEEDLEGLLSGCQDEGGS